MTTTRFTLHGSGKFVVLCVVLCVCVCVCVCVCLGVKKMFFKAPFFSRFILIFFFCLFFSFSFHTFQVLRYQEGVELKISTRFSHTAMTTVSPCFFLLSFFLSFCVCVCEVSLWFLYKITVMQLCIVVGLSHLQKVKRKFTLLCLLLP